MTSHDHPGIGPRTKACLAALVLAVGLAVPQAASAETAEPEVTSAAVTQAPSATTSSVSRAASAVDSEDVGVTTTSGKSTLSRTKTLAALVLAALLAIVGALIAFLRSGRDNTSR